LEQLKHEDDCKELYENWSAAVSVHAAVGSKKRFEGLVPVRHWHMMLVLYVCHKPL